MILSWTLYFFLNPIWYEGIFFQIYLYSSDYFINNYIHFSTGEVTEIGRILLNSQLSFPVFDKINSLLVKCMFLMKPFLRLLIKFCLNIWEA